MEAKRLVDTLVDNLSEVEADRHWDILGDVKADALADPVAFTLANFMVFRPRQRRQTLDISIQIDNNVIECVKETLFLGVILDEHLSWKPHILSVSRKISKSIGIIYKSSFCLPKTSLRCLYYSLV